MEIKVVEYNENWEKEYKKEESNIKDILGDTLISVHHIGSTSVKGLKAKPIIDILIVAKDINKLDNYKKEFENLGYEVMGEFGISGRRYYRKGGDNRTHQIHAFDYLNIYEIERHLIFRDYLRQNPDVCKEYGELKTKLAKLYPKNIDGYGDGKNDFVKQTEKDSIIWHFKNRE